MIEPATKQACPFHRQGTYVQDYQKVDQKEPITSRTHADAIQGRIKKNSCITLQVAADTEKAVSDTEEVVADSEKAVSDTEEVVADTEEVVADKEEAVDDTEEVAADTEKVVAD